MRSITKIYDLNYYLKKKKIKYPKLDHFWISESDPAFYCTVAVVQSAWRIRLNFSSMVVFHLLEKHAYLSCTQFSIRFNALSIRLQKPETQVLLFYSPWILLSILFFNSIIEWILLKSGLQYSNYDKYNDKLQSFILSIALQRPFKTLVGAYRGAYFNKKIKFQVHTLILTVFFSAQNFMWLPKTNMNPIKR